MTELIKLLHEEIDRLEGALTAERQRADGLQAQLADERRHVAELYERLTPATTLSIPTGIIVQSPMSKAYTSLAVMAIFL